MPNQERITSLLLKKLRNELTGDENQEIEDWLKDGENRAFFEQEIQPLSLYNRMEERAEMNEEAIDKRVYSMLQQRPPVKRLSHPFRWLAAAVVFFILSIAGILFYPKPRPAGYPTEPSKQLVIHPGSNKARLQLANGNMIELDTVKNGAITGTAIVKDGARVDYTVMPGAASSGVTGKDDYNILSTPRAGQYQLILPDGSKVWLNNASTLKYPVVFNGKERRVELKGEAYFEITKHTGKPFLVSTQSSSIEALGTSFNVSAYADEDVQRTTLIDGKVRVKTLSDSLLLNPGEQAEETRTRLSIRRPDVYSVISWRRGFFNFSDADIETVMRQIGRWYDVRIRYAGRPAKQKLEGSISRNQNLAETLAALELLNIHTRVEDSTVIVLP
jgi:ferric-dicitrate binding protein FerR (iron transport regulator)